MRKGKTVFPIFFPPFPTNWGKPQLKWLNSLYSPLFPGQQLLSGKAFAGIAPASNKVAYTHCALQTYFTAECSGFSIALHSRVTKKNDNT